MNIQGKPYRSIWEKGDGSPVVQIIDQRWLPHEFVVEDVATLEAMARAIREMHLRGAPLIGVAAAYGLVLGLREGLEAGEAARRLLKTRPTAVNLKYAVEEVLRAVESSEGGAAAVEAALQTARRLAEESVAQCRAIGEHGLPLLEAVAEKKGGEPVHILTHCNAGWLACIDYGTATAPIYLAHRRGIPLHVWVDETRPRNQGARLTCFELAEEGVPHTLITDNTGGHLMQHGRVDLVLVGSDRTTRTGDVANKIGTYLKALAAHDNGVPFYVALPSSSIDFSLKDGLREIPIEQRSPEEVKTIQGLGKQGLETVLLAPENSPAANFAFDVTPARLVTALITERGLCAASEDSILALFPEKRGETTLREGRRSL